MGTLLMDVNAARKLQWYIKGTRTAASSKEIEESFNKVKIRYKDLKEKGEKLTDASLYKSTTNIRLTQEGIDQATIKKLDGFDLLWKASLPQWDSFPADAQLALLSIAWAMGVPATIRQRMKALYEAVVSRDFTKAAEESHFTGTSSKREWKNQAYEFMFLNAALRINSIKKY